MSEQLTALETAVTDLEGEDTALAEAVTGVMTELQKIEAELEAAKSGGEGATNAQLEALATRVSGAAAALTTAVGTLQQAE